MPKEDVSGMKSVESLRPQDLGDKTIIFRHLDRLSMIVTGQATKGSIYDSVRLLELHLFSRLDEEYVEKRDELLKDMDEELDKDEDAEDQAITKREYAFRRLALLKALMNRKNMDLGEVGGLESDFREGK